jgi:hypothetical protein
MENKHVFVQPLLVWSRLYDYELNSTLNATLLALGAGFLPGLPRRVEAWGLGGCSKKQIELKRTLASLEKTQGETSPDPDGTYPELFRNRCFRNSSL